MKYLKNLFSIAIILLLSPVPILALDDFSSIDIPSCGIIKLFPKPLKPNDPNRPKAPSMQQIFCYYEDGQLTFEFAIPEGDCLLTVTDLSNNFARSYSFSSEAEATVYVGTLTEAYIEISTASGHEYEGYIGSDF